MERRSQITNEKILSMIKECESEFVKMGYSLNCTINWYEFKSKKTLRRTTFGDISIGLNTLLYNEQDNLIKETIYHELAHVKCGLAAGHGPQWQLVIGRINRIKQLNMSRLCDRSRLSKAALEAIKPSHTYIFKCSECGNTWTFHKQTKFVKTWNQLNNNGERRWRCTCGGEIQKIK